MARVKKTETALTPEERLQTVLVPDWEQPYKVPKNWCWTRIGTINQYSGSSVDPAKHPKKLFELYSVPSSTNNYPEIVSGAEIGSTKQAVQKNDVLLCKINPRINRVWKVSGYTDATLLASSEWIVVRNSQISADYLMYCCQSRYFREFMLSNVSGVGGSLMRAQPKHVQTYPIPLPPLPEQQRIVDRIESLFAKLEEVEEKAQATLDSFESRKTAILHNAFTGELTTKWRKQHMTTMNSWETKRWGDFIRTIEAGKNWKAEGRPPHYDEFGVVKVSAVTWGEFNELESKTCTNPEQWNENTQIKPGDFLFSRANTLQLVGNCVIVGKIGRRLMLSDKILKLSFNQLVEPFYILYFTRSDFYRQQVEQLASGNQESMRNISQNNMKMIEFPIPSIPEQQEIIRTLNNVLAKEQQAKNTAEAVLRKIDLMKKSILARAFRGELGTNDPAEEPSVKHLKQILDEDGIIKNEPKASIKKIFIPSDIKAMLSNNLEEKIVKLLLKATPEAVPIQKIMAISSKKFELMEALRKLEGKQLIYKNEASEYLLTR